MPPGLPAGRRTSTVVQRPAAGDRLPIASLRRWPCCSGPCGRGPAACCWSSCLHAAVDTLPNLANSCGRGPARGDELGTSQGAPSKGGHREVEAQPVVRHRARRAGRSAPGPALIRPAGRFSDKGRRTTGLQPGPQDAIGIELQAWRRGPPWPLRRSGARRCRPRCRARRAGEGGGCRTPRSPLTVRPSPSAGLPAEAGRGRRAQGERQGAKVTSRT